MDTILKTDACVIVIPFFQFKLNFYSLFNFEFFILYLINY